MMQCLNSRGNPDTGVKNHMVYEASHGLVHSHFSATGAWAGKGSLMTCGQFKGATASIPCCGASVFPVCRSISGGSADVGLWCATHIHLFTTGLQLYHLDVIVTLRACYALCIVLGTLEV